MPLYNGVHYSRGTDEAHLKALREAIPLIDEFLGERMVEGSSWLHGTKTPNMADIAIFPILERIVLWDQSPWQDVYNSLEIEENGLNLVMYVTDFRGIEELKKYVVRQEAFHKLLN